MLWPSLCNLTQYSIATVYDMMLPAPPPPPSTKPSAALQGISYSCRVCETPPAFWFTPTKSRVEQDPGVRKPGSCFWLEVMLAYAPSLHSCSLPPTFATALHLCMMLMLRTCAGSNELGWGSALSALKPDCCMHVPCLLSHQCDAQPPQSYVQSAS